MIIIIKIKKKSFSISLPFSSDETPEEKQNIESALEGAEE